MYFFYSTTISTVEQNANYSVEKKRSKFVIFRLKIAIATEYQTFFYFCIFNQNIVDVLKFCFLKKSRTVFVIFALPLNYE